MCIISGCDYHAKGVPKFGPVKALKYVQEHSDPEIDTFVKEYIPDYPTIFALFDK
jgi:5'-3' exonuclease